MTTEVPPESSSPILSLRTAVNVAQGLSPSPIVIHDDFGLGRCGVYIAIDHGVSQYQVCAEMYCSLTHHLDDLLSRYM